MDKLKIMLDIKAQFAGLESLMRQILAINEKSLGHEHPNTVASFNKLAEWLQDMNRLDEAEPLMRRRLLIFLDFSRRTGHEHPHLQAALVNYAGLLRGMGRSEAEIEAVLETLRNSPR